MMNDRDIILPTSHSKPIGKYSPGISVSISGASRLIFISGQVSTDVHGHVLGLNDPEHQTEIVFQRINSILSHAGARLSELVSLVIYLVDREHFSAVSEVRNRILQQPAPTSTLVIVSQLAEKGCLVEISGIAVIRDSEGRLK
ncbi:RidA family protein [Sodalis sp. C49]|uniref:RidA family protein n=1 Tax=unclassified Sodalis (in: enterobacteria) TaxID=2636512 RepID=UPI0039659FAF